MAWRSTPARFLLASFLIAACSSTTTTGDGGPDGGLPDDVCAVNPFDPKCGEECFSSTDCGENLYCSQERCRADCTPDGAECGPNRLCVAHGQCTDECAGIDVELTLVMPTIQLLIDQSGSMGEDFGGMTRWAAMRQALVNQTEGVVYALQDQILFGASLYTSNGGSAGGECPILETEPPGIHNADDIRTLIVDNGPSGDTPTGESIQAVVTYLAGLPEGSITPVRFIVLATDGEPDTCAQPNPQNGQEESIAGAQAAFAAGVRVVVLSVGSDVSAGHLQDMANAGAGKPVGGAEHEPYYVANNPAELTDAFDEIAQNARSCLFTLNGQVTPPEYAAFGKVVLNGTELTYNDPNGWRLIDGRTLELLGTACQTYLTSDPVSLTATFPCGAIAPD